VYEFQFEKIKYSAYGGKSSPNNLDAFNNADSDTFARILPLALENPLLTEVTETADGTETADIGGVGRALNSKSLPTRAAALARASFETSGSGVPLALLNPPVNMGVEVFPIFFCSPTMNK
jgi:hypothetical protein